VTVVTGDGAQGHLAGAPYDRVIATAAVRVGELPYPWIARTRPGGVIVTPMRTDFGGSVPLVRFTDNGTVTDRPVGRVGFMAVRSRCTPDWSLDRLDPDDPAAEVSTTTLKLWRVAENHDVRSRRVELTSATRWARKSRTAAPSDQPNSATATSASPSLKAAKSAPSPSTTNGHCSSRKSPNYSAPASTPGSRCSTALQRPG
jgi:hypothetical protein